MFLYIFAATASRATARALIEAGVPDFEMPLAIGAVALPVSLALLYTAERAPASQRSGVDLAQCGERQPVTSREQLAFVRSYAPGILCIVLTAAIVGSLRLFRDSYTVSMHTAALGLVGGEEPTSLFFFLVDVPGSIAACAAIYSTVTISDSKAAPLASRRTLSHPTRRLRWESHLLAAEVEKKLFMLIENLKFTAVWRQPP